MGTRRAEPEQIAAWLRRSHPDGPGWHGCHETIYQAVSTSGLTVLRGLLPMGTACAPAFP